MDTEAIRAELKEVQTKIKDLKSNFSKKRDTKEEFFAQGEQYSEEINKLYDEVKSIEKENNLDKINEELDSKKAIYDDLKKQLEEVEGKLGNLKDSTKKSPQKPAVKTISVEKAKKELKQLDLKLQTQVLNLDKESELIRKIAHLKEVIGQHDGSSSEEDSDFKKTKREYNTLRRKFNNIEKKIRSFYKQIRLISKEKKIRYKRIDELRDLRKKSYDQFKSQKEEYSEVGKDLKDLFKKESELLEELGETPRRPKSKKKPQVDSKELKKKQKEVEESFLKGGTLTTEDLLMFQRKK